MTLSNNGLHQTKGARSGRFAADRLEAPFAGEAECSTVLVMCFMLLESYRGRGGRDVLFR